MKYSIIPLTIAEANTFVSMFHRHNRKVPRGKWALGCMKEDELIGVAITGNPIARMLNNKFTLEILRVCVKPDNPGACSMLYARCKRVGQMMGYKKIITYTLESESGSSLRAIGAKVETQVKPGGWSRPKRHRSHQKIYEQTKLRWML